MTFVEFWPNGVTTNPNRKIFEARKRETAALGAGEKLVLGHPLAATIGDSARCMQNLEKVLFTGPKDLRHGDVYLRLGLTIRRGRIHRWDPMSLSRRAIFPSILLRRGTLFQLDSASFPCRFSARSITIIGWHAPPDRGKPSDAGLPPCWRRVLSRPLSTVSTPRKLRELDTCVLTDFVGATRSRTALPARPADFFCGPQERRR